MKNPSIRSHAAQITFFTKLIAGVNLHILTNILLGGQTYSAAQMVAVFTALLQADTELDAARVTFQQKLVAQRAAQAAAETLMADLKAYVMGTYGKQNPMIADFGFTPFKAGVKTVKVMAEAAVKSKATRVARNTLGPKQKASIHGVVPAPEPVVVAPASVPAVTPGK